MSHNSGCLKFPAAALAIITILLCFSAQASITNWRTEPDVWREQPDEDPQYVYRTDPCVEALRIAMEQMEPFLATDPHPQGAGLWSTEQFYNEAGLADWQDAKRGWAEAKLQCWRH